AQFRERCLKPLSQKIWVYDAVGNADIEDVLAVMLYAYQRFSVASMTSLLSMAKKFQVPRSDYDQRNLEKVFRVERSVIACSRREWRWFLGARRHTDWGKCPRRRQVDC